MPTRYNLVSLHSLHSLTHHYLVVTSALPLNDWYPFYDTNAPLILKCKGDHSVPSSAYDGSIPTRVYISRPLFVVRSGPTN